MYKVTLLATFSGAEVTEDDGILETRFGERA